MNSCYAIINYLSESVKDNNNLIMKAIRNIQRVLGIRVNYTTEEGLNNLNSNNNSWHTIDEQYEEAKKHNTIIVFGGDGTKTYILNRIIKDNIHPRFFGVSCGTMNIGEYSTPISLFLKPEFRIEKYAINTIVSEIKNNKYYSFIDTVVATTCVTRIDGVISQISANAIMQGIRKRDIPSQIGDSRTIVISNTDKGRVCFAPMKAIMTIGVAKINKCLAANIMAGGADPAACLGYKWGIIVSDFPLIWADASLKDTQFTPITSQFFPLTETDTVTIRGCMPNAYCIIDGNAVSPVKNMKLSYSEQKIELFRLTER